MKVTSFLSSKYISSLVLFVLLISACVPGFEKEYTHVDLSLEDADTKRLLDLADKQEVDSLYQFFRSKNPAHAYLALQGFASIQDAKSIDSIAPMLDHDFIEVRAMAAYALGQLKDEKVEPHLLQAFKAKDTLNTNNILNKNILEAIGKCGGEPMLNALSTISTYRTTDTLLLEGQALGLYRYALRGMTSQAGTNQMLNFILDSQYPSSVRLIAANYLARAKDIDIDASKFQLLKHFTSDPNPHIRLALATAISNTADLQLHSYLISQLEIEKDERVLLNIMRGLSKFPYIKSVDKMISLIGSRNIRIARIACQFLVDNGVPSDASFYRDMVSDTLDPSLNALLYTSVLKNLPHYFINTRRKITETIFTEIDSSTSVTEKVAFIKALAYDSDAYLRLKEIAFATDKKAISTSSLESIQKIITNPTFTKRHKSRHIFRRREIADILIEVFQNGDTGMMAVAADMILEPETKLKDIMTEVSYLIEARNRLNLPQDIETYNKVQEAIDFLNGTTFVEKKITYNHPINWSVLESLSDSTEIVIKTSKGNITFEPYPFHAPGSVANFVSLADSSYYDGKSFHRVVPNFVIQGGCPRGDGYGSLDYTIRSEFAPLYYDNAGYVGMASAGPDTEGVQFFITHVPTPHLDGRYSIFGKVTEGMKVIERIDVGDVIEDVIIKR